ncbi:HAMP domain-containing sensor histidine kinase [Amycolatopsis sp. La24]|uniref:sensor histidine kinase n=1 Tax=Amycolatopsis sp. La24 TaxID=3028304 RepID=UPI0023B0EEF9|nr:HAMP domain-containing sensor histidine kinase [Amycolatopsis sp. La24]
MRRRIAVGTVLAALVAICLFGVPLAVAATRYFAATERAEVERAADAYAVDVSADVLRRRTPSPPADGEDPTELAVYRTSGELLAGAGPAVLDARDRAVAADEVRAADDPENLVVIVPISEDGAVAALVRAATPRTELYQRTAAVWAGMAGLAVVALLSAYLVARRQSRRLAQPLESLSATAARLGEGELTARTVRSGISEIDSVGESLDSTAGRLDDLLARERAFTADASHQLRTPLAAMRLQMELALEDPRSDLRATVETSLESLSRLDRTVTDLLALARDTPPVRDAAVARLQLAEIAREWTPVLARLGRDLTLSVEPAIAETRLSGSVLRQVLSVLLDNAARHGSGTVAVVARDAGGVLAVDVGDEGPGLPDGVDVFRRRAAGARGTGIGLALARRLAEVEGGRLRVNRPRPAVFTLLLPVQA